MNIKTYPYGPLASNMYILETCSGTFLFDPSVYPDDISDSLPERIDAIICTHGHFDHINAIDLWKEIYPSAKIFLHKGDFDCLNNSTVNCSAFFSNDCNYQSQTSDFADFDYKGFIVEETPGHSPGSVCIFYEEDDECVLFSGDTLFNLGIGRSDLPGGSNLDLFSSLKKLKKFNEDAVVYPGHGPKTSLKFEFKNNPYL